VVVQSDHIYVLGVLLCYVHIFMESCLCVRDWCFLGKCAGITCSVMCELSRYRDWVCVYEW